MYRFIVLNNSIKIKFTQSMVNYLTFVALSLRKSWFIDTVLLAEKNKLKEIAANGFKRMTVHSTRFLI